MYLEKTVLLWHQSESFKEFRNWNILVGKHVISSEKVTVFSINDSLKFPISFYQLWVLCFEPSIYPLSVWCMYILRYHTSTTLSIHHTTACLPCLHILMCLFWLRSAPGPALGLLLESGCLPHWPIRSLDKVSVKSENPPDNVFRIIEFWETCEKNHWPLVIQGSCVGFGMWGVWVCGVSRGFRLGLGAFFLCSFYYSIFPGVLWTIVSYMCSSDGARGWGFCSLMLLILINPLFAYWLFYEV